jgi:hypothetical protein
MRIYLVMGSTGLYEDRYSWVVKAYTSKELAKHHAMRAIHRAKEIIQKAIGEANSEGVDFDYELWYKTMEVEKNEFDEKFICDTGQRETHYWVTDAIELDVTP